MKNRTIQQFEYHRWANNRIFNHLKDLPDDIYNKEIESVFSSVSEVIVHIYRTDGMWLSVMSGDPFEETMTVINRLKEKDAGQDLDGMQKLYAELSDQYAAFLNEQDDLDAPISIEHPKYGELKTSVAELVKHVVNHGTYHRGNVTAMLRQQGHAGVPTDYIFYLYEIA